MNSLTSNEHKSLITVCIYLQNSITKFYHLKHFLNSNIIVLWLSFPFNCLIKMLKYTTQNTLPVTALDPLSLFWRLSIDLFFYQLELKTDMSHLKILLMVGPDHTSLVCLRILPFAWRRSRFALVFCFPHCPPSFWWHWPLLLCPCILLQYLLLLYYLIK